jgi:hypothetical protein
MEFQQPTKKNMVFTLCLIIAMLIMIPIMWQFTPDGRFPPGTYYNNVFKTIWYICGFIVLLILIKLKKFNDNIIGSIMVIMLGPITLLTVGLSFLSFYLCGFFNFKLE